MTNLASTPGPPIDYAPRTRGWRIRLRGMLVSSLFGVTLLSLAMSYRWSAMVGRIGSDPAAAVPTIKYQNAMIHRGTFYLGHTAMRGGIFGVSPFAETSRFVCHVTPSSDPTIGTDHVMSSMTYMRADEKRFAGFSYGWWRDDSPLPGRENDREGLNAAFAIRGVSLAVGVPLYLPAGLLGLLSVWPMLRRRLSIQKP